MGDNTEIQIRKPLFLNNHSFTSSGIKESKQVETNYDTFPQAKHSDRIIITQSKFFSSSLYKEIIINNDKEMKIYFILEIKYCINSSKRWSGGGVQSRTPAEWSEVAEDILGILQDFPWMTKQQFPVIMKMGMSGRLNKYTEYTHYSLLNLINWIKAYYDKVVPILMKQTQYEFIKKNPPKLELTKEQKKEKEAKDLVNQLNMLRAMLKNPYAYIQKEKNTELKEYFAKSLKSYWYRNGYALNIAFDYLLEKDLINPKKGEMDLLFSKQTVFGFEEGTIKPSDATVHAAKWVHAKNEYMSNLMRELMESEKNIELAEKF